MQRNSYMGLEMNSFDRIFDREDASALYVTETVRNHSSIKNFSVMIVAEKDINKLCFWHQ